MRGRLNERVGQEKLWEGDKVQDRNSGWSNVLTWQQSEVTREIHGRLLKVQAVEHFVGEPAMMLCPPGESGAVAASSTCCCRQFPSIAFCWRN
jgi:hypothetical protein